MSEINQRLSYGKYQPYNTGNASFSMYDNSTSNIFSNNDYIKTSTNGNDIVEDELTKIFFSHKNMKRLQKAIKKEIYYKTNKKYLLEDDQDENDLTIAMRAVYFKYGKYLPNKIIKQTKILNRHVVDYVVPDMITNIKQYYGYLKDINEPLQPIMLPINVNNGGRKTLPSISTIFGLR